MIDKNLSNGSSYRRSYLKGTYAALAGAVLLIALRFMLPLAVLSAPFGQAAVAILWLIVFLCGLGFTSGLVVLTRESRERRHQPDLFYQYFSRVPSRWTSGWRRYVRPLLGPALRPGDLVCVRDAAEILATLDEFGKLDGMPFMPEMLAYQGRELLVDRRIDKINDWIGGNEKRQTKDIVTLVDVRCNGAAHGGCQAACQIYWNERWLRRATATPRQSRPLDHTDGSSHVNAPQSDLHNLERLLISVASRQVEQSGEVAQQYLCQITELIRVSTSLSRYDLRQDLRPLLNGNLPLAGWLIAVLTTTFNGLQNLRCGVGYPVTAPQLKQGPTPVTQLNLRPGELVRVRSKHEIGLTLYKAHNRGIWFGDETLRFCNQQYTVLSRVERIIDERSGNMITINPPCVILESVCASGEFLRFCPQNEYVFWREIWLERVESR